MTKSILTTCYENYLVGTDKRSNQKTVLTKQQWKKQRKRDRHTYKPPPGLEITVSSSYSLRARRGSRAITAPVETTNPPKRIQQSLAAVKREGSLPKKLTEQTSNPVALTPKFRPTYQHVPRLQLDWQRTEQLRVAQRSADKHERIHKRNDTKYTWTKYRIPKKPEALAPRSSNRRSLIW